MVRLHRRVGSFIIIVMSALALPLILLFSLSSSSPSYYLLGADADTKKAGDARITRRPLPDRTNILRKNLQEVKDILSSSVVVEQKERKAFPEIVSCDSFSCWPEGLRRLSDNNSLVIIYCSSIEYAEFMLNFLCRLQAIGLAQNSALVALDRATYALAKANSISVLYDPIFGYELMSLGRCDIFRSSCFTWRTHLKTVVVTRVLALGYNVLFSDVDVVWVRNPIAHLWNRSSAGTLLIQSDLPDKAGSAIRMLNSGFFLARNDSVTVRTFVEMLNLSIDSPVSQQPIFDGILCGAERKPNGQIPYPCSLQSTSCGNVTSNTSCVASISDLRTETLDRDLFPNGKWNFIFSSEDIQQEFPEALVIHNNWIFGLPSKRSRLKAQALWDWDSAKNVCISEHKSEFDRFSIPGAKDWSRQSRLLIPSAQRAARAQTHYELNANLNAVEKSQRYYSEFRLSEIPPHAKPLLSSPLDPKSIVIMTHPWAAVPNRSLTYEYSKETISVMQEYANANGYSLVSDFEFIGGKAIHLSRLKAIRKQLEQSNNSNNKNNDSSSSISWILWVDVDVLFTNHYLSLDSVFFYAAASTEVIYVPDCDQLNDWGVPSINTRMMLFRNSRKSIELLSRWEQVLRREGYGGTASKTTRAFAQKVFREIVNSSDDSHYVIHLPFYMMVSSANCWREGYLAVEMVDRNTLDLVVRRSREKEIQKEKEAESKREV